MKLRMKRMLKVAVVLGILFSLILTIYSLFFKNLRLQLATIGCVKCYIPNESTEKVLSELYKLLIHLQQFDIPPFSTQNEENKKIQQHLIEAMRIIDQKHQILEDYLPFLNSSRNIPTYVCPEIFKNSTLAYPHFLTGSWIRPKCQTQYSFPNIGSAITVVVVVYRKSDSSCLHKLKNLINSILKSKLNTTLRIAVRDNTTCADYSSLNFTNTTTDVKVEKFPITMPSGMIWNKMIGTVTTPFTLVGRNLDEVNEFTRLDRQVSVFDIDPRIKIVGGSTRNQSGHWQVGCYQTRLFDYTLEYKQGYRHSKNECMICDYITGPFIAKTEFLKDHKFTNYYDNIIFEYFFLNLTLSFNLIFNCPDAMYMSTDLGEKVRLTNWNLWRQLAMKWTLNRVVFPDFGIVHNISSDLCSVSCSKSSLTHLNSINFMMPICCSDKLATGLREFHKFAKNESATYQLSSSSVLGAVKLRDFIPWDFAGLGFYNEINMKTFAKFKILNRKQKVFLHYQNEKTLGYFKIISGDAFFEMFPSSVLPVKEVDLKVFINYPTLMRIRGVWVNGPPSPGLYARNYYGSGYLKAIKNWYAVEENLDLRKKHSSFFVCLYPEFPACLDKFVDEENLFFEFK